ncbi:hypothetical protein [Sulfurisphaera ohwakuensis]|uniref:hypothetical protein n=1 Tax=Sulfurisphaera ohwakuensis TaxID=69656 RepID=UPI0036F1C9B1
MKCDVVSAIFHPSVVTFVAFLSVILYLNLGLIPLLIVTVFYSLLPFLIVFIMKELRFVSDIYVSRRNERIIPMILALISYVIGLLFLIHDYFMFNVLLIYIINTLIILVVTLKFKISVHVSTTVGSISLLVFVLGFPFIFLYLFGILISYVRYKMKAHTLSQVISAWVFAPLSYLEFYIMFHTFFYVRT